MSRAAGVTVPDSPRGHCHHGCCLDTTAQRKPPFLERASPLGCPGPRGAGPSGGWSSRQWPRAMKEGVFCRALVRCWPPGGLAKLRITQPATPGPPCMVSPSLVSCSEDSAQPPPGPAACAADLGGLLRGAPGFGPETPLQAALVEHMLQEGSRPHSLKGQPSVLRAH